MSKLSKAIQHTITGNVRAARDMKLKYTDVSLRVNEVVYDLVHEKEMMLQVQLRAKMFVAQDMMGHAKQDLMRAMIEEVFGEFRPFLIEMRAAIYDEDKTRMRTLLAEMEEQMFGI